MSSMLLILLMMLCRADVASEEVGRVWPECWQTGGRASLSVCRSVSRSVSVGRSVCLSVCRAVCRAVRWSVCLSGGPSVSLSVSVGESVCLSVSLSVGWSVCLSSFHLSDSKGSNLNRTVNHCSFIISTVFKYFLNGETVTSTQSVLSGVFG